jgi:hypothetical protein
MSTDINTSFWAQQTAQLPALASSHFSYTDFTTAILQNLVESLGLERATYLTCVLQRPGVYEVSGESFPADRWFVPLKSSSLKLLSHNIVMKGTSGRYIDDIIAVNDKNLLVRAFQIALPKYGTQHILILTSTVDCLQPVHLSEDDKLAAFDYLSLFTYIATSMYLDKAEVIEFMRRQSNNAVLAK